MRVFRLARIVFTVFRFGLDEIVLSSLRSPWLQRLLRVADVRLQTGGGADAPEATFKVLSVAWQYSWITGASPPPKARTSSSPRQE